MEFDTEDQSMLSILMHLLVQINGVGAAGGLDKSRLMQN